MKLVLESPFTGLDAEDVTEDWLDEQVAIYLSRTLRFVDEHNRRAFVAGSEKAEAELRLKGLFDPEAQAFMARFHVASIRAMSADLRRRIAQTLLEAIRDGVGTAEAARRLRADLTATEARLRLIARTELNRSANWGRLTGWRKSGLVPMKEAIATHDDRVREDHLAADGEIVPIDEPFRTGAAAGLMAPPWEPNCLPGSQRIGGVILTATRMRYAGRLVRVRTASGLEVSATPNHPVLTPDGFIPFGSVHEGSHVVRDAVRSETGPRDTDEEDQPATAAQLFRSFQRIASLPIAGSAFHGDAVFRQGNVDVAFPERELLDRLQPKAPERVGYFALPETSVQHPRLAGLGDGGQRLVADDSSARGLPSHGQAPFSRLLSVHPAQMLRLGASPELDAGLTEAARQKGPAPARRVRNGLQALAGHVAFDEVTQVGNLRFSDHVYDFQARNGALWSNGISVSNCRCTVAPVVQAGFQRRDDQAATIEIGGLLTIEKESVREELLPLKSLRDALLNRLQGGA